MASETWPAREKHGRPCFGHVCGHVFGGYVFGKTLPQSPKTWPKTWTAKHGQNIDKTWTKHGQWSVDHVLRHPDHVFGHVFDALAILRAR